MLLWRKKAGPVDVLAKQKKTKKPRSFSKKRSLVAVFICLAFLSVITTNFFTKNTWVTKQIPHASLIAQKDGLEKEYDFLVSVVKEKKIKMKPALILNEAQELFRYKALSIYQTNTGALAFKATKATPLCSIFLTESHEVFLTDTGRFIEREEKEGKEKTIPLIGFIPFETKVHSLSALNNLAEEPSFAAKTKDLFDLLKAAQDKHISLEKIEFKENIGFFIYTKNIEVLLGFDVYAKKLNRLDSILQSIEKETRPVTRIDLNFLGKAFIKRA